MHVYLHTGTCTHMCLPIHTRNKIPYRFSTITMTFLCKLVLDVCFSFYTMKLEITFCWLTNLCLKEKKRKMPEAQPGIFMWSSYLLGTCFTNCAIPPGPLENSKRRNLRQVHSFETLFRSRHSDSSFIATEFK